MSRSVATDSRPSSAATPARRVVLVLALLGGLSHPGAARGAAGVRPARQTPFARGVSAFRLGSYADAEGQLTQALGSGSGAPGGPGGGLRNPDWARYLRAESAFFSGHYGRARQDFQALVKERSPRFAAVAAYRLADCLWSAGDRAAAVEAYRRLPAHPPREVDAGVGRFRMALFAEEQGRLAQASKMFLAFYREFPAHPWSAEAARHLAASPGAPRSPAAPAPSGNAGPASASAAAPPAGPSGVSPQDRLRRAEALGRDRNWDLALEELEHLPPDLPPALLTERDYQIGMTKFNMRRDYAGAARLLLAAAPRLTGDKAASAWFHGTRALSRIDQDDAAIAGYRQVVARFPGSRFAAEAQFLSGWLDYNRGRYRESLPGLQATLDRFGHSAFADDAAWCLAFALFQLGDSAGANQAFTRYAAMPTTGMTADEQAARVMYWRARLAAKLGDAARAEGGYREVNRRWPFTFYGVAARARLAEAGVPAAIELPPAPPPAAGRDRSPAELDARTIARIDELASVGLDVEAGWELERDEKSFLDRAGDARSGGPGGGGGGALGYLLEEYDSLRNFHRAYELSEARNGGALASAPTGPARIWWKAAYPLAYRDLVDRYGPPAGNPDLFLYAIMRKESGYAPWDVSSADARGLLQMIPPTSARLARSAGLDFTADDLFDPEVNVRLGALYIGALASKFHGQIPLVAGAYNAGPKAMAKWCDQHGKHPTDEFVELIAFTQTREYAKRVVGIYARYRHLYGPTPYQLPLQVDPIYDPGGLDY